MKPILTAQQMRDMEQAYFEAGTASIDLMERAAAALCDELLKVLAGRGKTCVFACGTGGNGGDGYAAARLFAERGGRAIILPVGQPRTADAIQNFERARGKVFACADVASLDMLPRPDAWADCLFGIGLSRAPEGDAARVIKRMNADREAGSLTVSADIPSGLCADDGTVFSPCVCADVTVAFQTAKPGHWLGGGMDVCGRLAVCDIGIPSSLIPDNALRLAEGSDAVLALPMRRRTAHKNDFGHLLIVAGSRGMAGAAAICTRAALRSGVGLTTVACPESCLPILQMLAPEAMCLPLPETDGALNADAAPLLGDALRGKTAVAAGCGLSMRASSACIRVILEGGLPAVLDADALNLIAADGAYQSETASSRTADSSMKNDSQTRIPAVPGDGLTDEHPAGVRLRDLLHVDCALTPHPGEAARLNGRMLPAAEAAAQLHALGPAVLLKGACSLIVGNGCFLSATGSVGMAKGGSGDALTGIVGALLAQGLSPTTALWLGSELHGRAGALAAEEKGTFSMLPTDLIEALPRVFLSLEEPHR